MNQKLNVAVLLIILAHTTSPAGANSTLDLQKPLSKIAFGACAIQNIEQPIWKSISMWGPDLFLFLGDTIYAKTNDMSFLRAQYTKLRKKVEYRNFIDNVPVLAVWDDNDYGSSHFGSEYPEKAVSQQIFLDFFDEPIDSVRRATPGIYTSRIIGTQTKRVQIILLDTRFFKTALTLDKVASKRIIPNTTPDATILGEDQWFWLENELKKPAEIRIIASSIQVINNAHEYESWGNFPLEKERLFKLINKTKASGVFFISGDRHFSEVSAIYNSAVGYPIYDFTSSGLTHSSISALKYENPNRVGPAYLGKNFGTLLIDWKREDPLISFQGHDINGRPMIEIKVKLSTLAFSSTH